MARPASPSNRYRICTTRIHYCNPAVCVFCALFVWRSSALVGSPRARAHTPSFSFAWNGALSAFRTLVLVSLCERNAGPLLYRETMSTRDRRTTRHKRENRLFRFAGSRGKTSSLYSFLFSSSFFTSPASFRFCSLDRRVNIDGVFEHAWEKSAFRNLSESRRFDNDVAPRLSPYLSFSPFTSHASSKLF